LSPDKAPDFRSQVGTVRVVDSSPFFDADTSELPTLPETEQPIPLEAIADPVERANERLRRADARQTERRRIFRVLDPVYVSRRRHDI
jgi:hypothetical protein